MSDAKRSRLKKSFQQHKKIKVDVKRALDEAPTFKSRKEATKLSKRTFKLSKNRLKNAKLKAKEAKIKLENSEAEGETDDELKELKGTRSKAQKELQKAKKQHAVNRKVYKIRKKQDNTRIVNKSKQAVKSSAKRNLRMKTESVLSDDEQLGEIVNLEHKTKRIEYGSKKGIKVAKIGVKGGKSVYNTGNRLYNLTRGNGFQRTPVEFRNSTKIRRSIQRNINRSKTLKTTQTGFKGVVKFFKTKTKFKVSAIGMIVLFIVSLMMGPMGSNATSIYQDDYNLTESWTEMTKLDAKHSDSENVFYTPLDDVMYYMNYKYNDYGIDDFMNPKIHIGKYRSYFGDIWKAMNGESSNYKLTSMNALNKDNKSKFHLSDDDYKEMKDLVDEVHYSSLSGQLDFPVKTDNLSIKRRYGYERSGENTQLHNRIDAEVKQGENVSSPMAGIVQSSSDSKISILDKKTARVTISNVDANRFNKGQEIKADDLIGNSTKSSLGIKYEKYDDDKKAWFTVNPAFYLPKVTYLQFTTLASSDFSPGGDVSKRAREINAYLTKLGYTREGIAAVLGNFSVESNINPKRAEGDYLSPPVGASADSWDDQNWLNMGGTQIYNGRFPNILHRGLGLGQWTDTADGGNRHTLLLNFSNGNSKKWYDLENQFKFILDGDTPGARTVAKNVLSRNAGNTVPGLTQYFLNNWEGNPGDKLQERIQAALNWYNYLGQNGGGDLGESGKKVYDKYRDKIQPEPTQRELKDGWPGNAYTLGNCTWYVYNREAQLGHFINPIMGNAAQWVSNYSKTAGASLTGNPQRGDAVVFTGGIAHTSPAYGHVAFVEYVNDDGSFVISEMNYGGVYQMNWRVLNKQAGMYFIHFA